METLDVILSHAVHLILADDKFGEFSLRVKLCRGVVAERRKTNTPRHQVRMTAFRCGRCEGICLLLQNYLSVITVQPRRKKGTSFTVGAKIDTANFNFPMAELAFRTHPRAV